MTIRLWFRGPFPSMNEIVASAKGHGGRGGGYSRLKKAWTEYVASVARGKAEFAGQVTVGFLWLEENQRRDPDNIVAAKKFVLDGLVDAGLLLGDRWKNIRSFTDEWAIADGGDPGCYVTISDVT